MKPILDTIDSAIKRLVSPVTMLAAAALLSKGLDKPDANIIVIKALMVILALWAVGYAFASTLQAIREFESSGIGKIKAAFMSSSFILVYFVLFVAAIKLGLDKIA